MNIVGDNTYPFFTRIIGEKVLEFLTDYRECDTYKSIIEYPAQGYTNNRERESAVPSTTSALPVRDLFQRDTIPAGRYRLHFYYTRKGKFVQVENLFAQQYHSSIVIQKGEACKYNMDDQEQFLSEVLQKAIAVVDTVENRYREAAFPIILQTLIRSTGKPDVSVEADPQPIGHQTLEPSLPPTLSVNEFFRRVNPDTHPARFVTVAYYLLHTGKAEQFTQADILEVYRKLRQPAPKNPTDVMNQCIRKAHIIEASDNTNKQKYWVITPDGEKFVEGLLHDNAGSNNPVIG